MRIRRSSIRIAFSAASQIQRYVHVLTGDDDGILGIAYGYFCFARRHAGKRNLGFVDGCGLGDCNRRT